DQGLILYVSPAIQPVCGYAPAEVLGRPFSDFIHPDDLPTLMASFVRTLAGQLEPLEYRVLTRTGGGRWMRSSSPPTHPGGRVTGVRGVMTDITPRKRAEDALRASQHLLESIVDNSTAVISVKDTDGKYVLVNSEYERLLGRSKESIAGK